MVHASNSVFAAIVLLKGRLPREIPQVRVVIKGFEENRLMADLLKRIADVPAEGGKIDGSTEPDALLKQLLIAHLRTLHDAQFLCKQTVTGLKTPRLMPVTKRQREVVLAQTCVIQQVMGSASVTSVLCVCMQTPRPIAMPFE